MATRIGTHGANDTARDVGFVDLLDLRVPAEPAVSPDGSAYAFVLNPAPVRAGVRPRTAVHIGSTAGGHAEPVDGEGRDATPAWSPDGHRLAFASDRDPDGGLQPYVRDPDGTVRALARVPGDAESLRWSPDGDVLLVLVAETGADLPGSVDGTRARRSAPDPTVRRPTPAWRRLYRVPADGRPAQRVGPDALNVWEFDWRGGRDVLAVVSDEPGENDWYLTRVAVLDLDRGDARTVHESRWALSAPTLAPDGRTGAVIDGYASDRGQGFGLPVRIDLATGATTVLDDGLDAARLTHLADGRLFYVGQRGLHTMCGLLGTDGGRDELWSGPGTIGRSHLHQAAVSADGQVVVATFQAPDRPPEVATLDRSADGVPVSRWRSLTAVNASLEGLRTPVVEEVSWTTDDGTRIEGALLLPADRPSGPLPLVVFAHGGPNNAWTLVYSAGYNFLALPLVARGYAMLFPNQRGSTGRGQDFARAHIGDYGAMDLRDVLSGVDALAERGVIDRARVGIIGGSAGGYLSAWAATAGRGAFAASVPIACVSNWVSFHNTSNIPRLTVIEYDGADPYDPDGPHVRFSPVYHARGARTPTLILHGELDTCTPLGQAQELYQALTSEGCEAELVAYPREGHNIRERDHLLDMWERVSGWFDRTLAPSAVAGRG